MASTTWTLADLEALEDAIKKGVRRVEYQDRKVEYRSLNEMLRIRDIMRDELGCTVKGGGRGFAKTDKGLGC